MSDRVRLPSGGGYLTDSDVAVLGLDAAGLGGSHAGASGLRRGAFRAMGLEASRWGAA